MFLSVQSQSSQALCQQDKNTVYLWYLIKIALLLILCLPDKHCMIYIIKITVTVTQCDINPVNSPRGFQVLESVNLGHCKTSAATASHTSTIIEKTHLLKMHANGKSNIQFFSLMHLFG